MSDRQQARDTPSRRERLEGRLARLLAQLPGAWLLRLIGEEPLVVDGLTLDSHIQFILASRRRRPQLLMCEPTPDAARARNRREIAAIATSAGARPTRVRSVANRTIHGADGALAARHYVPFDTDPLIDPPLLVFFHGGGFVICDLDTHDEACRILCSAAGVQVLSVAYRLAPEHPYPAAVDDCCAALRWAQREAASLGADPSLVCVGGDSAGGNLATVAALTVAREGNPVAAQLLIYPTTDASSKHPSRTMFAAGYVLTSADMDAFHRHYLGDNSAASDDVRVSPARASDLALAPPALVITAGFDPLRDEGEAYAAAMECAGVTVQMRRVEGMVHGFIHMTAVVPAARAAMVAIAKEFGAMVEEGDEQSG